MGSYEVSTLVNICTHVRTWASLKANVGLAVDAQQAEPSVVKFKMS